MTVPTVEERGPRPSWELVSPARNRPARDRATAAAVVLLLAVVGPGTRAAALPYGVGVGVVVRVALLGAAGVLLLPRSWWLARLVVAGAAGAVLLPGQGQLIAAWVAGGLLLGVWIGRGSPVVPDLPRPGPGAVAPALALGIVATVEGRVMTATWQPLVPLLAVGAIPFVSRWGQGRLDRASRAVGRAVAAPVSAVCFTVLGLVVVGAGWLVHRALGFDPLPAARGWIPRDRSPIQAAQPWAVDPGRPALAPAERRRQAARLAAVALLVAGVVAIVPTWTRSSAVAPTLEVSTTQDPPGSWEAEYHRDIAWVMNVKVALRPFELYRLMDVQTRYVNIRQNRRVTWQAPACRCKRLTLWLYGGSGAFGLEQRDDHTIASDLARLAYRDGIVLDVVNRGIPDQLHWRASTRFAWDLVTDPHPNLAVFYEGAEDVQGAEALNDPPVGDIVAPYEPFLERWWDRLAGAPKPIPPPSDGIQFLGRARVAKLTASGVGTLAARRYNRSLQMSDDQAAAAKVPVRYFWQPTRSGHLAVEDPSPDQRAADTVRSRTFAAAARALDPRVGDLSNVFQNVNRPVFVDALQPDELGAQMIAEAMYRALRPSLRRSARANGQVS